MTAQIWDQLAAIGKSAPGAWDELPPLPQGAVYTPALGTVGAAIYTFTADQMRAYAAAAVALERERCLAEVECGIWINMSTAEILDAIAAAIRGGDSPPVHGANVSLARGPAGPERNS